MEPKTHLRTFTMMNVDFFFTWVSTGPSGPTHHHRDAYIPLLHFPTPRSLVQCGESRTPLASFSQCIENYFSLSLLWELMGPGIETTPGAVSGYLPNSTLARIPGLVSLYWRLLVLGFNMTLVTLGTVWHFFLSIFPVSCIFKFRWSATYRTQKAFFTTLQDFNIWKHFN